MRSLHPFFLLVFIVFFGFSSSAAVPNDTPCSATNLGILDTATVCPFSTGGTPLSIFNQSNAFANAEPAQPSLQNCQGISGNMPVQSKDCWYKFRVRAHSLKVVLFGNINTPYIALYQYTGNCMSMVPVDCAKGSVGYINTEFNALVPGSEYYLQVTGSSLSDVGGFDLVISNTQNCLSCTQDAALFVDHAPVNGYYHSNDTVNFCYMVNGYKRKNNNSLHGVVPIMGPGWNPSITYLGVSHSTVTVGSWVSGFLYNGLPFSLGNKKGFFFDANNDGTVQNNLGDPGGISDSWTFCWKAVTNTCPSQADLNIKIYTFSDGQTGTGPGPGCVADDPYHFAAVLNCCGAIDGQESTTACATLCTGGSIIQINPNSTSFPPLYYYAWFDQAGTVINTSIPSIPQYGDTLTGLCMGDYSVVVTNTAQNCFLAEGFEIETAFTIHPKQLTFSCGTTNAVTATVNAVPSTNVYSYSWSNGNTNQTANNLLSGQTYTVYVTTNGCTLSEVIKMEPLPFSDPFFMYPSTSIVKCSGSPQFVFPFYIATPGGTFSCGTPNIVDSVTGAINVFNTTITSSYQIIYVSPPPCQGSYIVTITIVGADPAYFHYAVDVVCAQQLVPIIPDSVASYGGVFSCSPPLLDIDPASGIISPPFVQGSFIITYTSPGPGNCQNIFTETIDVNPAPTAPQGPSNGFTYCPGDPTVSMTVTLSPPCPTCFVSWFSDINFTNLLTTTSSPYTYTAPTNQQTPIFFYLVAYDFVTGCVGAPTFVQVTMAPYPNVVSTTTDSVVCPGFDGTLHATPNNSYIYSWEPANVLNNPAIPDPTFNIQTTTTFTVFVTDNNTGCSSSCVHTIVVDSTHNCDTVIFYHGFTPNGDLHNDSWVIDGIHKFPKNRVSIFTRWGEKVWEANDYDNRTIVFEGKNQKGKELVAGTYYYVVEVPDKPAQKGWVELSR